MLKDDERCAERDPYRFRGYRCVKHLGHEGEHVSMLDQRWTLGESKSDGRATKPLPADHGHIFARAQAIEKVADRVVRLNKIDSVDHLLLEQKDVTECVPPRSLRWDGVDHLLLEQKDVTERIPVDERDTERELVPPEAVREAQYRAKQKAEDDYWDDLSDAAEGNPLGTTRRFRTIDLAASWSWTHREELERYRGCQVAIHPTRGVVAHGRDFAAVYREVERLGLVEEVVFDGVPD